MILARVSLIASLLLMYPVLAIAQQGPGCGPANIKFDVSTGKKQIPAPAPQAGKAFVYFLQDDLDFQGGIRPTTRFGIDGKWVGATHANSYFYVAVDPGEHDVCANWQSVHFPGSLVPKRSTAAIHLTTEDGKTYYLRARDSTKTDHTGGEHDTEYVTHAQVVLASVEADEAQVLINSFSFSSFHQKN